MIIYMFRYLNQIILMHNYNYSFHNRYPFMDINLWISMICIVYKDIQVFLDGYLNPGALDI